MKGIFRYGKSIAASLLLAAVGLIGRYAPGWFFPHVDPLPGPSINFVDAPRASPPIRKQDSDGTLWKLAVVTNRTRARSSMSTDQSRSLSSLADQVADAVYHTAESHFQLCDVCLPTTRARGDCPVDEGESRRRIEIVNSNELKSSA